MKLIESKFGIEVVLNILNIKRRESGNIKRHSSDSDMSHRIKNKFQYSFKKKLSERLGVSTNTARLWCYGMSDRELGHALFLLWKRGAVNVEIVDKKLSDESAKRLEKIIRG